MAINLQQTTHLDLRQQALVHGAVSSHCPSNSSRLLGRTGRDCVVYGRRLHARDGRWRHARDEHGACTVGSGRHQRQFGQPAHHGRRFHGLHAFLPCSRRKTLSQLMLSLLAYYRMLSLFFGVLFY